jgi:hypothetical protein
MLASTLGIEFDSDAAWNERRKFYEVTNRKSLAHTLGQTQDSPTLP